MKKRSLVRWTLLAVFIAAILWIAVSENSCAQGFRALVGRKPDQPVLNSSFQIAPHAFRYYQFSLPAGSKNMTLVGHFTISAAGASPSDTSVEALVLTDSAFESWRTGNASPTIYDSGKVTDQKVQLKLPPGEGVYYLVFSNRFNTAAAKRVTASLALHSTSWLAY